MANFSLVANTSFTRRNYDDLTKSLDKYKEEYDKQHDAINELGVNAAAIESMANEQTDPIAYNTYKQYANNLREQANMIATNGLDPNGRANLLKLKRNYAEDIIPIQTAYNRRAEQEKAQMEMLAKDPTHLFDRMAATTSLDDYLANKSLSYQNYSGALLTKQVEEQAKNFKEMLQEDLNQIRYAKENGQPLPTADKLKFGKLLYNSNGYISRIERLGYDAGALINNDDAMMKVLEDEVLKSSGISKWQNYDSISSRVMDYINQGRWAALGSAKQVDHAIPGYGTHAGGSGSDYEFDPTGGMNIQEVYSTSAVDNGPGSVQNKIGRGLVNYFSGPQMTAERAEGHKTTDRMPKFERSFDDWLGVRSLVTADGYYNDILNKNLLFDESGKLRGKEDFIYKAYNDIIRKIPKDDYPIFGYSIKDTGEVSKEEANALLTQDSENRELYLMNSFLNNFYDTMYNYLDAMGLTQTNGLRFEDLGEMGRKAIDDANNKKVSARKTNMIQINLTDADKKKMLNNLKSQLSEKDGTTYFTNARKIRDFDTTQNKFILENGNKGIKENMDQKLWDHIFANPQNITLFSPVGKFDDEIMLRVTDEEGKVHDYAINMRDNAWGTAGGPYRTEKDRYIEAYNAFNAYRDQKVKQMFKDKYSYEDLDYYERSRVDDELRKDKKFIKFGKVLNGRLNNMQSALINGLTYQHTNDPYKTHSDSYTTTNK